MKICNYYDWPARAPALRQKSIRVLSKAPTKGYRPRAGFFVGDGTGVGKGRILAGIIADNFNQRRERALWLSVNNDLIEATRRDLTDLGLESSPLARINDYSAKEEITLPRGVLSRVYAGIEAGGVGAMEMVSRDMKALGMYLSGSISFDVCPQSGKAVEYRERIHRLTPEQKGNVQPRSRSMASRTPQHR